MADISGRYEFHRDASSPGMQIVRVDSSGSILEGQVGQSPIHGQYVATTNTISFNDAHLPGDTLYVSFYSGYVMLNGDGSVYGMAGTYQELELPRRLFEARTASSPTQEPAASGATAAVGTRPGPVLNVVYGGWYAIRLDEPLV
jgi:hypothetical protein